jgi:hypothetical protein
MQANDQVPAPQGKATHGFYWSGQPLRANLVCLGGPKMAKIAPRPWESGVYRVNNIPIDEVPDDLRRAAKAVNFDMA